MMDMGCLPVELWRVILAYLPLPDLGRCCLVCRAWRELILSLDKTRWRQLCLGCPECRHPNWPSRPHVEPASWREALRQHALATRTWTQNGLELDSSHCLHLFRRKKDRRSWHVGTGCKFETLRGALAAVAAYDRVVLHPGVYEEQADLFLRLPVEIVGSGKLGEVTLVVSIDQQCPTARLCNLVLMPAWFSPVVYKTSSGHVQLDNCNIEGGLLQVRGPGTCQARFCSFGQSSGAHFQGVALSLLESCDFSGSDSASVTVEDPPVSDRNWACKHLAALVRASGGARTGTGGDDDGGSAAPPSTAHRSPVLAAAVNGRGCMVEGTVIGDSCSDSEEEEEEEEEDESNPQAYKLSYEHHGLSHMVAQCQPGSEVTAPELHTFQEELQQDREAQILASTVQGCLVRACLFRDGKGGMFVCNHGQARLEGNVFRGLMYAVRCIQNAKIIMLRNEVSGCRASGVFLRLSAQGLIAENNIHSNGEAGLDIRKGANPIILCNRIHSGLRSGIVILGNGKGSIRSNRIYSNKEAGIYILYNGNPVVSGNYIFQGQAAGIAVNENGRGMIVGIDRTQFLYSRRVKGNMIQHNQWGGVDIRRGGDPILRNNYICYGYSDGVVLGEKGRGLIEGNHIYCNKGCGVWVMSSSLPQLLGNRINCNGIYGVAVFCRKEQEGNGERGGGGGGNNNFNEEGELLNWENDLDSEDERFSTRRPVSIALVEGNCVSHNGAVGMYVNSSEALSVMGNAVYGNRGVGVALLQSGSLTRLLANCIAHNCHAGVSVESGCRVELRGNGIYDNGGHGVSCRGDAQIVENDVVGNRGCGIRLMEMADVKVLRNRVQPVRGSGISVLGQVKGLVQENVVFQGRPSSTKPLVYQDPNITTSILINNTLLACSSRSKSGPDPTWMLENPPPCPQPESQPAMGMFGHSAHHGISMTSRISSRVESGCHSNRSIFCSIL